MRRYNYLDKTKFGGEALKTINILWGISLMVIGICTVIFMVMKLIGVEPADFVKVVIGVLDLIALPVLAFTTVKRWKNNEQ